MWSKFLMAGVAGAALLAFSPAQAQDLPGDCDQIATVGDITQAGSCTLFDKVFSNFSFDDIIGPGTPFQIDVEFLPGGDVFSAALGELTAPEQGESFGWEYTVEITQAGQDLGNEFDSVGLTHEVGAAGPDVTTTKDYQLFDATDTQIGASRQLQVSGDANTTDIDMNIPDGTVRIDVQDSVTVAADGIFNGASNEFEQRFARQVPLPATLGLFGVGLLGLAYSVRRKA